MIRLPGGLRTEIVTSIAILALMAILMLGILLTQIFGLGQMSQQLGGPEPFTIWDRVFQSGWIIGGYILVAMVVLITFGSYMISRNVLQPLLRLVETSERIARGDYEIDWGGYPAHEIGRLAEALRHMAERLEANQRSMQKHLEELERSNEALVQAHQALVRSEKLASVGRLAAGVAHEVGNPIGSIMGFAEILLADAPNPAARDCLERIRSEAERVQRTLRSLLDLARPGGQQWSRIDINVLVHDTLAMVAAHKGMRGVSLETDFASGLPPILADRDQIQQVLVNLLLNALDALAGQGLLRVQTGSVSRLQGEQTAVRPAGRGGAPGDADYVPRRRRTDSLFAATDKSQVYVQIEDTGTGIHPDNLPYLFEPFYTTKAAGEGTGLGLTVCLGIVESYGGRMQVESDPGRRTVFTVYLPAAANGPGD
jgi:two-component system NtrC family sensor kinase